MSPRCLLLTLCVLAPGSALAAEDPLKGLKEWIENLGKPLPPAPPPDLGARNTFTVSPIAFSHQMLGVEYERAFGQVFSLALAPEFAWSSSQDAFQLSLGGTLALRLFVLGSAPSGIYFGPEVSGLFLRTKQGDQLSSVFGLGLGGGVGWTLVLFNKFTVSAGFSATYRQVPDPDRGPGAVKSEILALPRLNFGVAF